MALITKASLVDLAIKQKLYGATIYFADDSTKIVEAFELDFCIEQICLKFTDGTYNRVNFREKFEVETVDNVERINNGKVKMHKK